MTTNGPMSPVVIATSVAAISAFWTKVSAR